MTLAEIVGKRTRQLLVENKMSQYRLVKLSCLNEKTISDIVKGRTRDIKLSTVYAICNAFDMSIADFFNATMFKDVNIDL